MKYCQRGVQLEKGDVFEIIVGEIVVKSPYKWSWESEGESGLLDDSVRSSSHELPAIMHDVIIAARDTQPITCII